MLADGRTREKGQSEEDMDGSGEVRFEEVQLVLEFGPW